MIFFFYIKCLPSFRWSSRPHLCSKCLAAPLAIAAQSVSPLAPTHD